MRKSKRSGAAKKPRVGPRGGTTSISPGGLIRKSTMLEPKEEYALRLKAFRERVSESSILRRALLEHLGLVPRETAKEKGKEEKQETAGKQDAPVN